MTEDEYLSQFEFVGECAMPTCNETRRRELHPIVVGVDLCDSCWLDGSEEADAVLTNNEAKLRLAIALGFKHYSPGTLGHKYKRIENNA